MHPAFAIPRDSLGTECPDETIPATSAAVCGTASDGLVGATLQPDRSDDEREARRIDDEGVGYFGSDAALALGRAGGRA